MKTLLAGISLALAFTACTPVPTAPTTGAATGSYLPPLPAGQQVTIQFANYNVASVGIGRDATLKMIANFEKKNPNIKVDVKGLPVGELVSGVRAAIVAGNPPDLYQGGLQGIELIATEFSPLVLDEAITPDELKAHYAGEYPVAPKAIQLGVFNGKTIGLPYVFSTPTFFYNADLLKAAGLDPANPPKTWDEVKKAGLAVKEKTGKGGIYIACIEASARWCDQSLFLSNGGRLVSEDRTRATFAEGGALETIKFWQDLVQSGAHVNMTGTEAQEAFMAGNIAMFLQTSALQGTFIGASNGKWDLRSAGMPSFGNKPVKPTNSGSGLYILAKDPLKQRAAWELMKYLTSEEAFTIITSEIGYLPLRPGIIKDDRYLKPWVSKTPLTLPNLAQLEYIEPSTSFPGSNSPQMEQIYGDALNRVLRFGDAPESTMQTAASRVQELFPRR